MECSYQCEEGESIMLDWCQSSSSRQQFVHYEQDDSIRPVINKNLCMTDTNPGARSEDYPIRLRISAYYFVKDTIESGDTINNWIHVTNYLTLHHSLYF